MSSLLNRLAALFRKPKLESELNEEIRAHLEMAAEENIRRGMAPETARREARRSFGGVDLTKEAYRDQRGLPWLEAIARDLRFAARALRHSPGFTLVAVLTLGLGVGANTAVFSLVDAVLLRQLPFAEPERLVFVWEDASKFGYPRGVASLGQYESWRHESQSFAALAAYQGDVFNLIGEGSPERLNGFRATANLAPLLGVEPLLGRWFTEAEDTPEAQRVAVLSWDLWRARFGADAAILGRPIRLNEDMYTVIGVMPPGFHFPYRENSLWAPIAFNPRRLQERTNHYLTVVGRLGSGVSLSQAQAEMDTIARRHAELYPETSKDRGILLVPMHDEFVRDLRSPFWLLMVGSLLVLGIACANVANLLITRGLGRQREMAVRAALGAGRAQIARQLLVESFLLACLGAVLGLVAAQWTFQFLQHLVPPSLAGPAPLGLNLRLLGFALTVSFAAAIVFGLVPLQQVFRLNLAADLTERSGGIGAGSRARPVLVALETALAVMVVTAAALMIRTVSNLAAVDPGFRTESVLTLRVDLAYKYPEVEDRIRFYNSLLERIKAIPGVDSVGMSTFLPYTNFGGTSSLLVEGRAELPDHADGAYRREISPDYLRTIGVPLLDGRWLSERDDAQAPRVILINEKLAELFEGGAVGKRLKVGSSETPWLTVVGVVGDIREEGLAEPSQRPAVYVPYAQSPRAWYFNPRDVAIRTAGDPVPLAEAVRRQVWEVDPEQTVSNVRTLTEIVDRQLTGRRTPALLLASFAGLALLLAALGVYGLLSFVVAGRRREFGLRLALGASKASIVALVVRRSLLWVGSGCAAGIAGSLAGGRLLANLLFGVSPHDAATLAGVTVLLVVIGVAASCVPALRAMGVDPMTALRYE